MRAAAWKAPEESYDEKDPTEQLKVRKKEKYLPFGRLLSHL